MRQKALSWLILISALAAVGCAREGTAASDRDSGQRKAETFSEPQYQWHEGTGETLTVWGIDPDMERTYLVKAFERFEELTEDELELVQIPKDQFEEMLISAFEGKSQAPDILLSYGGTNIEAFEPEKNFYDFTDAVWVKDLTDTSINQTVYRGKILGLPHWEASISGTLYNKEIFKKYHLEVPKTQEEFLKVCEALKQRGVTPLYLPIQGSSMLLYQFPLDAVVEDGEILQKLNDGTINYADIPQMQQIVEWYRTMAQNGYLGENYLENDWDGMSRALDSGEYAMMLCWDTWLYTDFTGDASRFGLMPAFVGIPRSGTFEGPNLGLFLVNKNSPKLDSALNFVTFLADPYNYNAAFEGIYTAPVFKNQVDSISTPQYLEAESLVEQNYRDSTAWLRIRGFSQMDASCIVEFMSSDEGETALECVRKMDELRNARLNRQDKN